MCIMMQRVDQSGYDGVGDACVLFSPSRTVQERGQPGSRTMGVTMSMGFTPCPATPHSSWNPMEACSYVAYDSPGFMFVTLNRFPHRVISLFIPRLTYPLLGQVGTRQDRQGVLLGWLTRCTACGWRCSKVFIQG